MIYINAETPNDIQAACAEIKAIGFDIVAIGLAPSWEGRPPEHLIIARRGDLTTVHIRELLNFAAAHNQECIAIRLWHGIGLTVGSKPVEYREEYFRLH